MYRKASRGHGSFWISFAFAQVWEGQGAEEGAEDQWTAMFKNLEVPKTLIHRMYLASGGD